MPDIRVRLAPSPTGEVHIGTIWIALFNWAFAKQHGGKFIVRIEDTDRQRLVPGSQQRIFDALEWYGLTIDEGPDHGGDVGPYIQSERLDIYRPYAEQLIASGHAYYCFCSAERLAEVRAAQQAKKLPPKYDKHCAHLDREDAAARVKAGESHVIRLNVPTSGTITAEDLIRHQVTFGLDQLDDSVLVKSDGFPTYHLANVIDDHLMQISHVIRAEEWLPSLPKHLLLYQAFGWTPPAFAHMPLILGADRQKLSKRHGGTSALSFRDEGYLPAAMVNFLALMGWHPKGESEILALQDIVTQFRFADVNPSGAIFDRTKLDWFNGWYIRHLSPTELMIAVQPFLTGELQRVPATQLTRGLAIIQERLRHCNETSELLSWLPGRMWDNNVRHLDMSIVIPKKGTAASTIQALHDVTAFLSATGEPWEATDLKTKTIAWIAQAGKKNGEVLWPLRVALTLQSASPDVFDVLSVLGQEESLRRVNAVVAHLH